MFVGTSGAGSGWRCYGYDRRSQVDQSTLSVTTPDAGSVTQTVNMLYNNGGEITTLIYPNGEKLTATYDTNGRTRSAYFGDPNTTDPVQFLVGQISYTNDGQVAGVSFGGSGAKNSTPTALFSTTTTYDSIQRPLSATLTEAGKTVWKQTRTYDNVGNVLGLNTTIPTQGGGTATENESFCYDALNRLIWAGNSGTPTGGDHCMISPSGTTLASYTQKYSYDNLDRISTSPAGTYTYGDQSHLHAVTGLSNVPSLYSSYDAMGNMICRNVDPTSGHTCAGSTPTGATMSYDALGQLTTWNAPSGTAGSAHYLYDNEGKRVLTNSSNASTTTDTIYFDGYTETVLSGGNTTTTNYYSVNGSRLAQRTGSTFSYLLSDSLGSNTVALNSAGQVSAFQHYSPYGVGDYGWGSMPNAFNYTGQRLDSQTGLLYYNFRYYDPITGRFVRSDNVEDNSSGMDPYAYVGDNPETHNDPSGHCLPLCAVAVDIGLAAVTDVAAGLLATAAAVIASPVVIAVAVVAVIAVGAVIAYNAYNAWQASKSNYNPNKGKHFEEGRKVGGRDVGAEPKNATKLWEDRESSTTTVWKIPGETDRWVGYDPETGEFIIFDDTNNGEFHSHVRPWSGGDNPLPQKAKNELAKQGVVNPKTGKVNQGWLDKYQQLVKEAEDKAREAVIQREKFKEEQWYKKYGGLDW